MGFRWLNDQEREFLDERRRNFAAYPETSYQASGTDPAPISVFRETGSERESKFPDVVPALTSKVNAIRIFDQMVFNDATVDVSLRAAKSSLYGATFYVEPYSDSQDDLDIAEFCCYNTVDGSNEPFLQTIEKILRMYEYGLSVFEPVYTTAFWAPKRAGANARRYTMLKKLAYRPASTIFDFKYDDNGGPAAVVQNAIRSDNRIDRVTLDIENLVIFAFDSNGGPFNGRSLLRKAYKHWYYKDYLYKIDAIQKERHSLGVPKISLMQGFTQKEVDASWKLVQNLRANEDSGVVLPPGVEFEFAQLGHTPVNVMPSIEHHDVRILLNTLTEFLLLGLLESGGGGRSTGATGADMLQKANRYIADYICSVYNMFVFPKLVAYNFRTSNVPQMRVKRMGETKDLQMWGAALANLAAQGLLTPSYDTEQFIREELDAPYLAEDVYNKLAQVIQDAKQQKGDVKNTRTNGTGNTNTVPGYQNTQ